MEKSTVFNGEVMANKSDSGSSPEYIRTETKNAYLIVIKLFGVDKNSILVKKVKENTIQVTGKNKSNEEIKNAEVEQKGDYYGKFILSFEIEANADKSNIEASFKNGLLTIRIPKTIKGKPEAFHIEVK